MKFRLFAFFAASKGPRNGTAEVLRVSMCARSVKCYRFFDAALLVTFFGRCGNNAIGGEPENENERASR